MVTKFIRPFPSIPVPSELVEPGASSLIDEAYPIIFEEADILASRHVLDVSSGASDLGYWMWQPRDAWCRGLTLITTAYDNGMVEVKPGGGFGKQEFGDLRDVGTGTPTDPIYHVPQLTETVVVVCNNIELTSKVIVGIVTARFDERLYSPHFITACYYDQRPEPRE